MNSSTLDKLSDRDLLAELRLFNDTTTVFAGGLCFDGGADDRDDDESCPV